MSSLFYIKYKGSTTSTLIRIRNRGTEEHIITFGWNEFASNCFFSRFIQDEGTIQATAIVEPEDIFHLPTRTNRGGHKPLENYQSLLETAT